MAFERHYWVDGRAGGTLVNGDNLNRIEAGIEGADQAAETALEQAQLARSDAQSALSGGASDDKVAALLGSATPTASQFAGDARWLRGAGMVNPDNFAGATDRAKVQAAVDYAIANGYPSVGFTRMFNLTGQPAITIDKNPWYDRRVLALVGLGGGIRKDDAGVIFTSPEVNTGDVSTTGIKYQSVAGAGTIVFDGDKLLRIISNGCDYRNVDRIIRQVEPGRWIQSVRLSHEHVVGGSGPAIEVIESYDTSIISNLFEDRDGGFWNVTPATGMFQNRNLRIIGNVMENMSGTPIKLGSCWTTVVTGNYFEQNGVGKNGDAAIGPVVGSPTHIDCYSIQPTFGHAGLVIEGNMFSGRATQKSARSVSVLLGRAYQGKPVALRSNVADGGVLFKMADYANGAAVTDGSNYVEGGDVFYPSQGPKFVGAHATAGTTGTRPQAAPVSASFFDTSLGKPVWMKTPGTAGYCILRLTAGADAGGNVTITLGGVASTVAVAAGDTLTQVRDKIVAAGPGKFWPYVPSASGSNVVRFDRVALGQIVNSPVFDGGATGVTKDYFGLDGPGVNAVWVDAAGTSA